jgi:hypothetical protein
MAMSSVSASVGARNSVAPPKRPWRIEVQTEQCSDAVAWLCVATLPLHSDVEHQQLWVERAYSAVVSAIAASADAGGSVGSVLRARLVLLSHAAVAVDTVRNNTSCLECDGGTTDGLADAGSAQAQWHGVGGPATAVEGFGVKRDAAQESDVLSADGVAGGCRRMEGCVGRPATREYCVTPQHLLPRWMVEDSVADNTTPSCSKHASRAHDRDDGRPANASTLGGFVRDDTGVGAWCLHVWHRGERPPHRLHANAIGARVVDDEDHGDDDHGDDDHGASRDVDVVVLSDCAAVSELSVRRSTRKFEPAAHDATLQVAVSRAIEMFESGSTFDQPTGEGEIPPPSPLPPGFTWAPGADEAMRYAGMRARDAEVWKCVEAWTHHYVTAGHRVELVDAMVRRAACGEGYDVLSSSVDDLREQRNCALRALRNANVGTGDTVVVQALTFAERPFTAMTTASLFSDYRVGVVEWVSFKGLGVRLECPFRVTETSSDELDASSDDESHVLTVSK